MSILDTEIKNLDNRIREMAGVMEKNLFYASDVYLHYDSLKIYEPVNDAKVNTFERRIETYCLQIRLKERLFADDLRIVTGIRSRVQDLERLGDHAQDLLQFALKIKNPSNGSTEISALTDFVRKMVSDSIKSYRDRDISLAKDVRKRDDHVDAEYEKLLNEFVELTEKGKCTPMFSIYSSLVVKYLERIADHATNIAEWVIYIITGYYKDSQIL